MTPSSIPAALARCHGAALVVMALSAIPYMAWFTSFCGPGNAASAARAHPDEPIGGSLSYAVARDDEVVLRCSNRHCPELPVPGATLAVPIACHEDLGCYCAPSSMDRAEAARRVGLIIEGAECVMPQGRACPPGRCARHLGE